MKFKQQSTNGKHADNNHSSNNCNNHSCDNPWEDRTMIDARIDGSTKETTDDAMVTGLGGSNAQLANSPIGT